MSKRVKTVGAPSSDIDPTERIISVIEGKELDRVQTLSVLFDDNAIQQVLGAPLIKDATIFFNPISKLILDKWGMKLNSVVQGVIEGMMLKTVEAAVDSDAGTDRRGTSPRVLAARLPVEVLGGHEDRHVDDVVGDEHSVCVHFSPVIGEHGHDAGVVDLDTERAQDVTRFGNDLLDQLVAQESQTRSHAIPPSVPQMYTLGKSGLMPMRRL